MPTLVHRRILLLLGLALLPLGVVLAPVQAYGPACSYDTILNGQYTLIPLKNQAMLSRERCGYRFRAGQQDSRLVVSHVRGGLRFHDAGSRQWKSIPEQCRRARAARGVAAWCPVPGSTSARNPMLLEIWPRLGDDYVDASTLPAAFQVAALVDAGRDVVKLGAGDDFVNGAFHRDRVWSGAGQDWVRTGEGPDFANGGAGSDRVVGADGADVVRGGGGNDSVEGSDGNDRVDTGAGSDVAKCGGGSDVATITSRDRVVACERVSRY